MGLNFKKRILLKEEIIKQCEQCKIVYTSEDCFCSICGKKLSTQNTKVYANYGKNGITSFSYVLPNGTTINTKGNMTIPISKGISYTAKTNKK